MNDFFILNGEKTLIYAVCLYDIKKDAIVVFQVSKQLTKKINKNRNPPPLIIVG
jgi:hypothetical protein